MPINPSLSPTSPKLSFARRCVLAPFRAGVLTFSGALLLIGCAGVAAPQTPASSSEAYVQQFEASYRNVRSLRADFTQTYTFGAKTRVESGHVSMARGGLMRWDYLRPAPKLFVSDGRQVSLYVPEERQLTRTPMKSSEDFRVPFELLLTRLNLRKVFARVDLADGSLDHDPGDHVLRGIPKKELAEDYGDVLIVLDTQFDIRRLIVSYPDRSRMDFRFDHFERNVTLPHSLFEFTPPAGTEIVDQR